MSTACLRSAALQFAVGTDSLKDIAQEFRPEYIEPKNPNPENEQFAGEKIIYPTLAVFLWKSDKIF